MFVQLIKIFGSEGKIKSIKEQNWNECKKELRALKSCIIFRVGIMSSPGARNALNQCIF